MAPKPIVLASGSTARAQMLHAAKIPFDVVPANVDEDAIREALKADCEEIDPADLAEVLARAKAEEVSARRPDALVIGADQVLVLGGEIFTKAADAIEAAGALRRLRGSTHELHSAVVIAGNGATEWSLVDTAFMTMRDVSESFLAAYLHEAGDALTACVGCYQIEGPGIELFEKIEGDYFTILGLPLLPLLAELRDRKALPQ